MLSVPPDGGQFALERALLVILLFLFIVSFSLPVGLLCRGGSFKERFLLAHCSQVLDDAEVRPGLRPVHPGGRGQMLVLSPSPVRSLTVGTGNTFNKPWLSPV